MQFNGKTDENGYLTDVSTNQQDGFNEYTIQDKYAPFLPKYYEKMRVINGIVSVPDNLPITQFEQEKADWEAQINQDKQQVTTDIQNIQDKLNEASNTITQLTDVTTKAQEALAQNNAQVQLTQKMLMQIQRANLAQQQASTTAQSSAGSSASASSVARSESAK